MAAEKLTDEVANSLYQNHGIISLEEVKNLKGEKDERSKAQELLSLLILRDGSDLKKIMAEFRSFEKLQPVIKEMDAKICKSNIAS